MERYIYKLATKNDPCLFFIGHDEEVLDEAENTTQMKKEITTSRFMSKCSKERMERDLAIFNEFTELTANPQASWGEVTKYLMKKYGLHSPTTIWTIRKRAGKLLQED